MLQNDEIWATSNKTHTIQYTAYRYTSAKASWAILTREFMVGFNYLGDQIKGTKMCTPGVRLVIVGCCNYHEHNETMIFVLMSLDFIQMDTVTKFREIFFWKDGIQRKMWADMQSTVNKKSQVRSHIELFLDLHGSSAGALSSQSFSVWEWRKEKIEREGQCKTHTVPRRMGEKERYKNTDL